ncbi:MAG: glycosyl hydrolase [Mariniphaga sp.]
MKKPVSGICIFIVILFLAIACSQQEKNQEVKTKITEFQSSKPFTRWWWFAAKFTKADIREQLKWVKVNNFGGVEIAFIYPVNRNPKAERFEWLGPEWQQMVTYAKTCSDSLGLGCDVTFGTLWPFGGIFVTDADRTKKWGDPNFKQYLAKSWTMPDTGNVLNHMDKAAFNRYAEVMGKGLLPAIGGSQSSLFCDSWEVETKHLWTDGFDQRFTAKFGYDIKPYMDSIYTTPNKDQLYDYMKLISEMVINEFYVPFDQKCHEMGALSRVQCAGSPTDLITAYASVDVPETEAMLYNPQYSKIVASAAALGQKPVVSSETFTCLYGWPANHIRNEQTADLKLVADALFANGVNQIFWHGMPFNPVGVDTVYFYASCHVGKKGSLSAEIPAFNNYMTKVSESMRFGKPYSEVAVYLPLEDAWIAGELPKELQLPWAWGTYELRYTDFNKELDGYHPLWINNHFLEKSKFKNGTLSVNDISFKMLYIEVDYMDVEALKSIVNLAEKGLPICLKKKPSQAGYKKSSDFNILLEKLVKFPNVSDQLNKSINTAPLVKGENLPEFWCRTDGKSAKIFFANPLSKKMTYPMKYGMALQDSVIERPVVVNFNGKSTPVLLKFEPYQSVLLDIDGSGNFKFEDITFIPKTPEKEIMEIGK